MSVSPELPDLRDALAFGSANLRDCPRRSGSSLWRTKGDAGYRAIETLTGWADLGSAEYKRNPRYVWRYLLEDFKPLPGCFVLKGSEFGDIGTSTCEA